ncbi:MAG: type II toxin-antitoxin system RelE/ParE family toxin [Deltaproteobacteria bacterium]|nr:type II toxin-antitoxin system RelE/ParE family toxin [Deltaproteobacteria bacterium]
MARYEVFIKPSALKEIDSIGNRKVRRVVVRRIQALESDPRPPGCKKLSGDMKYRIRSGNFRILYTIEDARLVVVVVKVGDRKDVYR